MNWKACILSLFSGILLFISFPSYDFHCFVWIALVPLLYALRGRTLSESFRLGLLTGLVYNVGVLYWVSFVVVHYGFIPLYLGIAITILMALCLGLYVSLFSVAVVYLRKRGIREIYAAPLLWTVLEFVKSYFLTGFPWENLAYAQYSNAWLIQIADITGIYGITFVIVLANCILFDMVTRRGKRLLVTEAVCGMIIAACIWGYGDYRIEQVRKMVRDSTPVPVSLIQGNIDQSVKWDPQFQSSTLGIYRQLSLTAAQSGPRLIVWPETAAPFYFQDIDERHRQVLAVAREAGAYLLFGSPSYVAVGERFFYRNSAYMVSPDGNIAGRYDKTHLVPFGEYVPLRRLLFFVQKLVDGAGDFMPGEGTTPLVMDGRKIGVLICYEGIFPEISAAYGRKGSTLLVNITNDAWYGRTSAPYQHLSMTALRAVENRLFLVRAANTGISAIIDPAGAITASTGLFERGVLNGNIRLMQCTTVYATYGDVFVYACMALIVCISLFSITRRNKHDRDYL